MIQDNLVGALLGVARCDDIIVNFLIDISLYNNTIQV